MMPTPHLAAPKRNSARNHPQPRLQSGRKAPRRKESRSPQGAWTPDHKKHWTDLGELLVDALRGISRTWAWIQDFLEERGIRHAARRKALLDNLLIARLIKHCGGKGSCARFTSLH